MFAQKRFWFSKNVNLWVTVSTIYLHSKTCLPETLRWEDTLWSGDIFSELFIGADVFRDDSGF